MHCTDDELVLAYRRTGDEEAFGELVRRYRHKISHYLRRYLESFDIAEDALQETLLRMAQKNHTYQVGRNFGTWLYTVARNQAMDLGRRLRSRRAARLSGAAQHLCSDEPAPIDRLVQSATRELVRKRVDDLPNKLRCVIKLAYYRGWTCSQIAASLGIPEGTAKSRKHRALSLLRDAWAQPGVAVAAPASGTLSN